MLENLFQAIERMEEVDDAWHEAVVLIESVTFAEDAIELFITIRVPTDEPAQKWRIVAPKPLAYRLVSLSDGDLCLYSDHVALWPYTKPRVGIYMHGCVPDPAPLLGNLLEEHRKLVGGWWPVDTFINTAFLTTAREHWNPATGYFSLGGPEPLMLEYIKVLEAFGLKVSIPEESPHYFTGQEARHSEERLTPLHLLNIGGSYIIASYFHAERVT